MNKMVNLSNLDDDSREPQESHPAHSDDGCKPCDCAELSDLSPLHPLHSNSTNTGELNMREFDADILELGVEEKRREDLADFDENGRRSVRMQSFSSLPDECCTEEGELPPQAQREASPESPARSPKTKSGSMPQICEDSAFHPLHHEEKLPQDDDYFVADLQDEEVDAAALALRKQSGRHERSDSFERRSLESAQFALAVGETTDLMLNKIIEEDSSSDFDDDEIDEAEEKAEEPQAELGDDGDADHNEEKRAPQSSPIHMTDQSTPTASPIDHVVQKFRISSLAIHPPYVDWKFTRQYSSGANFSRDEKPSDPPESELGYKGIRTSLLEVTQRGVSRGNYAQLHRKAWLEVSDRHHRYGKNLRMYYKHWEGLGHPYHMFFDWLDSKGEAEGRVLPELKECPRSTLDTDTVLYITDPEVSASYALEIVVDPDGSGLVLDSRSKRPVCTGKEGWIFVLRDQVLYGSQKVTAPGGCVWTCSNGEPNPADAVPILRKRFHHSSFFGGKAVASAGIFLTDDQGRLTDLWPHSGHYRPGEAHMQRALFFLQQQGVDLSTFEVDMQQIFKVCRKKSPKDKAKKKEGNDGSAMAMAEGSEPKKAKKTECLLNMGGMEVACFLAHKARMIEKGVFHQIHRIRRLPHDVRGKTTAILGAVNG